MPSHAILATIASVTTAFGVAMLYFRIQRELQIHKDLEREWVPWADRLLLGATLLGLMLVLLPIVIAPSATGRMGAIPAAACAASICMVSGYVFGILAHYRLIFGRKRSGPRENPEPAEKWLVIASLAVALGVFALVLLRN